MRKKYSDTKAVFHILKLDICDVKIIPTSTISDFDMCVCVCVCVCVCSFVFGLFSGILHSMNYIASDDRMIVNDELKGFGLI